MPNAENDAPVCERVCEYAVDVGLPEYSGLRDKPQGCGNCAHYVIPPGSGDQPMSEQPWEWHPDGPEALAEDQDTATGGRPQLNPYQSDEEVEES